MTTTEISNDKPPAEIDVENFSNLVASMSRLLTSLARLKPFSDADVGLAEWLALTTLAREDGISNKALGRSLGVSGQRANQICASLSKARHDHGHAVRGGQPSERDQDHRGRKGEGEHLERAAQAAAGRGPEGQGAFGGRGPQADQADQPRLPWARRKSRRRPGAKERKEARRAAREQTEPSPRPLLPPEAPRRIASTVRLRMTERGQC